MDFSKLENRSFHDWWASIWLPGACFPALWLQSDCPDPQEVIARKLRNSTQPFGGIQVGETDYVPLRITNPSFSVACALRWLLSAPSCAKKGYERDTHPCGIRLWSPGVEFLCGHPYDVDEGFSSERWKLVNRYSKVKFLTLLCQPFQWCSMKCAMVACKSQQSKYSRVYLALCSIPMALAQPRCAIIIFVS